MTNHISPLTTGYRRKKMWGGTTVYPRLFGVNISSMFLLRTTNKTGSLWLIRLDSTTPTTGESCTLARSQQAYSVTHRKDYKPFQRLYKQGIPLELPPKFKVKTLFVDKIVCKQASS